MKRIMLIRLCSMVVLLLLFVQADMLAQTNQLSKTKEVRGTTLEAVPKSDVSIKKQSTTTMKKSATSPAIKGEVVTKKKKSKSGEELSSKTTTNPFAHIKPNNGIPIGVEPEKKIIFGLGKSQ